MTLDPEEYPAYFANYIALTNTDTPLAKELETSFAESIQYLKSIDEHKKDFAYEEGKWTIGEVIQHLIDVELVMAHRAFRISRMDETDLPGFDHNAFAEVADVSYKSLSDLCRELMQARDVTNMHFRHLNEQSLMHRGKVSGNTVSIRSLGYIIIGHIEHHINIIKERYI